MSAPLVLRDVSVGYGGQPILRGIDAAFEAGRVVGLVGANGAGKTTLLRAAVGILPLATGSVTVLGKPLDEWSRDGRARAIAYLPQAAEPHWPVEVRKIVALGRLPHLALKAPSRDEDAAIDDALARCQVAEFAARRVDRLSAGERARVLLARALATGAPILLADEPAAHLDPAHQLALMELLREEAQRGTAVVVTLHELSLAARFCDTLVVLHEGRVLAAGTPAEALSEANLRAAFGVRAFNPATDAEFLVVPWQRIERA
jgi:iron complex transport system ATP-binding protein